MMKLTKDMLTEMVKEAMSVGQTNISKKMMAYYQQYIDDGKYKVLGNITNGADINIEVTAIPYENIFIRGKVGSITIPLTSLTNADVFANSSVKTAEKIKKY